MFISHKYKVIFVHIQRTGGTSILKAFEELDPDLVKILPFDPAKKRTKHCFASDIQGLIDEEVFTTYTKFSVVRNPFDRMVSWYLMLKQGMGEGDRSAKVNDKGGSVGFHYLKSKLLKVVNFVKRKTRVTIGRSLKYFAVESKVPVAIQPSLIGASVMDAVMQKASTFEEFVMLPRHDNDGLFERFYTNQLEYIAQDNDILVDHILHFENLANDFADFAKKIGFEGRLAHVNKSRRDANYRNYYNEQSKEIISQRFQRDITYFDYSF